jgi:hypothetical protein
VNSQVTQSGKSMVRMLAAYVSKNDPIFFGAILILIVFFHINLAWAENYHERSTENSLRQKILDICNNRCGLSFYAGVGVKNDMIDIFVNDPKLPYDWKYRQSYLAAGALSYKFYKFRSLFSIEEEIGIAKRFGNEREVEVWWALFFRWEEFPWNEIFKTTIGISTGINYANGIPEWEREKGEGYDDVSRFLHFFSPEMTLQFDDSGEYFVRFHHRSGVFGLITDGGGAHYLSLGKRFRF